MKSTMCSLFLTGIGLMLLAGMAGSCSGGKTDRKKMLNGSSLATGGETDFPFSTSNVDVQAGGATSTFLSVAMPDPAYDSMAINMIVSHEPFALPLLSEWASRDKRGILIDLRSNPGSESRRADYILERANAFITVMQSFPAVHCRCTDGNYNSGRQDCFSSASPVIDGPGN